MEKSQKKKLLLMFLHVQLDPVPVAPKDGKIETDNLSVKFNGFYPSLPARKDFCPKAIFQFFPSGKLNIHLSRPSISRH